MSYKAGLYLATIGIQIELFDGLCLSGSIYFGVGFEISLFPEEAKNNITNGIGGFLNLIWD
ncbi:MAG: hypothetical protein IJS22_01705 [Lachnospiraceae bacterium]|nr:hypothetical protein [Lachnospiraceae bacterium]